MGSSPSGGHENQLKMLKAGAEEVMGNNSG